MINLSGLRPLEINQAIELDRNSALPDASKLKKFREYARGEQESTLTEGQREILEGIGDEDFCDNVCHLVLGINVGRIKFHGFKCNNSSITETLRTWSVKEKLPSVIKDTHYATFRDGNYCLMLQPYPERGRVLIQREPWWDGNQGVFVGYDAHGEALYAIKEWDSTAGRRRVIYLEDRLYRLIRTGSGASEVWEIFSVDGDKPGPEGSALWERPDGSPLHIPIVHFMNGERGPQNYGTSELDHGVLGFQDQLNDLHFDMSAAGRMTGFQQIWMSGVELQKDAAGNDIPPKIGAGVVHHSPKPDARFGVLQAGDLSQLEKLYMLKLKSLSRITRTPLHLITGGDWPSGLALMRAEMPFIGKVEGQLSSLIPAWVLLAHRYTELVNATIEEAETINEDDLIEACFEEPSQRDPLQKALADKEFWVAAKEAIDTGIPLKVYLRRNGWTEKDLGDIPDTPPPSRDAQGDRGPGYDRRTNGDSGVHTGASEQ